MNYNIIYNILYERKNKNSENSNSTESEKLSLEDYLDILKDNEVKKFLDDTIKNRTGMSQTQLNKYRPEVKRLIEIYCSENDVEINDDEYDYNSGDLTAIRLLLNDINNYRLLTNEEEKELITEVKNNNLAAKEKFLNSNLRLVVSIAKRYSSGDNEKFMDAIGDGNEGLIKALDRFDLNKECKFSTYATWWIEQAIRRGQANNSRTIRIPVHGYDKINKIKKIKNAYELEHGVEPSDEYIANKLGMSIDTYHTFINSTIEAVSGDLAVGEDEHGEITTLFDFVKDESENSDVENLILHESLRQELSEMLDGLNEKEREILKLRFGFDDNVPRTLEEVGHIFGVTRERIRQIEAKSLMKLRRRGKNMKAYL